jgi:RNA polymerase sigma factor (sigma-70 family)
MGVLDERERLVLTYRYGLQGAAQLTLKEIGERLGVTREWVRKLELRAVRKLDASARSTAMAS